MMRIRTIGALCALVLTLLAPAGGASATAQPVTCVAHRGAATTHTEETLPTYSAALAGGAIHLDGDVRWTSTGYPYLIHNADMGLFGHPDKDIADITGTVAVSYLSASGDHIASLWDIRQLLISNPSATIEIELKTVLSQAQWDMLGTRIDEIRSRVMVVSVNLDTVRTAQDRGYRTARHASSITRATSSPIVDQDYTTITAQSVADLADVGVVTEAWTPNSESDWTTLANKGVTIINTDDVFACLAWNDSRTLSLRRK